MSLQVIETGALATVQDHGRVGWAHLGVPRSGALDRPAMDLANRLVGNPLGTPVIEVLLGGLVVRLTESRWVAGTGAPTVIRVADRSVAFAQPVWLEAAASLRIDPPATGARTYLAVGGGLRPGSVLGSASTDTLSGLGPAPLRPGDLIPLGSVVGGPSPVDVVTRGARSQVATLRVEVGPRDQWVVSLGPLWSGEWRVAADVDRVGLRVLGGGLERRQGELPSEPMVLGAIQVPPDGQPVIFLADHPTTGGYPVVAVVRGEDLWKCAQLRPGEQIRFVRS